MEELVSTRIYIHISLDVVAMLKQVPYEYICFLNYDFNSNCTVNYLFTIIDIMKLKKINSFNILRK